MKRAFRIFLSVIISSFVWALFGCARLGGAPGTVPNEPPSNPPIVDVDPPAEEKANRVRVYDIPSGVKEYDGAEIYIGQTRIPTYSVHVNTSQVWTGNNYRRTENGVCMFELDGTAEVTVKLDKTKTQIDYSSQLRPLSAKIIPMADIENNELTLKFKSAGEYVLEINSDIHNAIHFFVSDYGANPVDSYKGYDRIEIFEAGLHTSANDSRIKSNNNNCITVPSNTLVYLRDGAVVRGRFAANNARNVGIVGRGVIDGSTFVRDAETGQVTVPIDFNYCRDVLLEDFSILDPAGWAVNMYFGEDVTIDNLKIISSRSNGDGISLQSCKRVTVDGCFVRTWDDSLVVKNYPMWGDRSHFGETEDIAFRNCAVWTDLAQSMELGYETVGETFRNIAFDNITVLHALDLAPISIHNANNAEIENVTFRNITVEDGLNPAKRGKLIDIRVLYSSTWSDQHTPDPTPLGNVDGVTIENVSVLSAKQITMTIGGTRDTRKGFESDHFVSDVTVKNIALRGKRPTQAECAITMYGAYTKDFVYLQDANTTVTGASFVRSQTDDYLSSFGKTTIVERV